jgi:hypothetical protein
MKKEWYTIFLKTIENNNESITEIAKIKSKGLAYITLNKFKEIYTCNPHTTKIELMIK